jgi:lysophospholipase L1-like esterase
MLNKRNIPFSNPEIIAVTGWTSADLLRAIRDKQTPDPPFDVVSLLIGVNNQYQGRSLDEYKKEFSALLMQSIALAGNRAGHVIVLSIPDYAMTPFGKASGNQAGISAAIEAFNRINLEIAKQFQVSYIDVTTESRKAANDPALVAEDGLHYAAPEYTIWAKLLAARMETIFP